MESNLYKWQNNWTIWNLRLIPILYLIISFQSGKKNIFPIIIVTSRTVKMCLFNNKEHKRHFIRDDTCFNLSARRFCHFIGWRGKPVLLGGKTSIVELITEKCQVEWRFYRPRGDFLSFPINFFVPYLSPFYKLIKLKGSGDPLFWMRAEISITSHSCQIFVWQYHRNTCN